ncbi:MAG: ribonuclease E activity regulator RraA [Pseudonocardiaceae bacterium]
MRRDPVTEAISTADLVDAHGEALRVCDTQFRQFGRHLRFFGSVRTISCFEDNGLVKKLLNSPGEGSVLVVDGGGSLHTALSGDLIAKAAVDNGWVGLLLNGAVRDSAVLADLPIGIKALGTNPRKSAKDAEGEVDVPVTFGGVTFTPGDVLCSDEDGVALLPRAS